MEPEAPEAPEVVSESPPKSALTLVAPPPEHADALILNDPAALQAQFASYGEARKLLVEWLMAQLVPGVDYMLIHRQTGPRGNKQDCPDKANMTGRGCQTCGGKSTLAKPGSEKLCGLLRLRPRFKRDAETWEMLGSELGCVALLCELVTASGVVVAEGRGARHRDRDFGDVNKCIKMVQKSAQTDAVLRCAGLSETFTQDLEDMPGGGFDNGTEAGEFPAPRRKSETTTTATPAPATLQAQLEESVRRTAPAAPDRRTSPRPTPRPAPRAPTAAPREVASDAINEGKIKWLYRQLHDAVRGAEVPQEEHERVFEVGRKYLVEWLGRTHGREGLANCSYLGGMYDALLAQVPAAVDAALGGEGPPPRAHPRLVRRYAGPSRNVPRREF